MFNIKLIRIGETQKSHLPLPNIQLKTHRDEGANFQGIKYFRCSKETDGIGYTSDSRQYFKLNFDGCMDNYQNQDFMNF